jgi:murein DD-endopeptidase MepM/ murein hydrolase activator NlpD
LAPAREDSPHPRSFDPGLSTGYLRRGAREHDLPAEIGAAPFDPGPGTGYDERRARRDAKRRRREEEQRLARQAAKLEAEVARRERAEREAADRERRLAAHRERERLERRHQELRERRRREREARLERARKARMEREREARKRVAREREERVRKEVRRRRASQSRPVARRPRPAYRPARRKPGLGWPTARAALALAAVSAVAGLFGTAVGLPVPVLGEPGGPIAASLTGSSPLDAGTPAGLTKGPYFPVVTDNPDYGESDARFGAGRSGHVHRGQDVFAKPGTPLVAVRDGIVIDGVGGKSFYAYGGGNSIVIYSPVDDRSYVYLHMLHPSPLRAGETVRAGQPVGQVGCSGSCWGPHLHFEIRLGRIARGVERKAIDPLTLLQQWPAAPPQ